MKKTLFWLTSLVLVVGAHAAAPITTNLVSDRPVITSLAGSNRVLVTIGTVGDTNVMRQIAASNLVDSLIDLGLSTSDAGLSNTIYSAASLTNRGVTNIVYLAVRTDGRDGIGTAGDPRDASTAAKMDALFNPPMPAQTHIFFCPGTYTVTNRIYLRSHQTVTGAGRDVTFINVATNAQSSIGGKFALFSATSGFITNTAIEDLTMDLNGHLDTTVTNAIQGAIFTGDFIRVSRCTINNPRGNTLVDGECWGVALWSTATNYHGLPFGGHLIDDVRVLNTNSIATNDNRRYWVGLSAGVTEFVPTNGSPVLSVIRNSSVCGPGPTVYSGTGATVAGYLSIEGCSFGGVGNGIYGEHQSHRFGVAIRNSLFDGLTHGVQFSGSTAAVGGVEITGNTFLTDTNYPNGFAPISIYDSGSAANAMSNIVISGNSFLLKSNVPANDVAIAITSGHHVKVFNNIIATNFNGGAAINMPMQFKRSTNVCTWNNQTYQGGDFTGAITNHLNGIVEVTNGGFTMLGGTFDVNTNLLFVRSPGVAVGTQDTPFGLTVSKTGNLGAPGQAIGVIDQSTYANFMGIGLDQASQAPNVFWLTNQPLKFIAADSTATFFTEVARLTGDGDFTTIGTLTAAGTHFISNTAVATAGLIDWKLSDTFIFTNPASAQVYTHTNVNSALRGSVSVVISNTTGTALWQRKTASGTYPIYWPTADTNNPTLSANKVDVFSFVKAGTNLVGNVVTNFAVPAF